MNKSLRVKLSVTLMATVLVTMITSVLVNNFFLVDYYISGKQKSLVSAYSQINQLYNTFGVTYDSGNNESGEASEDETTDIYEWFGKGGLASLSDFLDFELSLEQLSQSNNMGILLYRIQNKRVINQKTVYDMQVLFSSSGSNSSSETDVENFSIYRTKPSALSPAQTSITASLAAGTPMETLIPSPSNARTARLCARNLAAASAVLLPSGSQK